MIKRMLKTLENYGYLPLPLELVPPLGLGPTLANAAKKLSTRDKLSPNEKSTVLGTVDKLIDSFEKHQQERDKATRKTSTVPAAMPLFTLTDEERRQLTNFCVYAVTKFFGKYADGVYHSESDDAES